MTRWLLRVAALALLVGTGASAVPAQTRHSTRAVRKAAAPGVKNVFWQPNELKQGSDAFFTVELERAPMRVSATWIGKTLSFFKTDNPKVWYALAGDDVETQPGSYDLVVTAVFPGGRVARTTKQVDIGPGNLTEGTANVAENYVEPDEAGKKQIAADEVAKTRAYAHSAVKPLWSGNFAPPVSAKPTTSFGESRILNEEKSSLHRGTDYPVPESTPVLAANSGRVVLAKEMFYEGQCVIVDHGQKFFTIYMHLSKTDVNVGDRVEKGKRLGLSGATGRVTGPHVHFGVRWNGAYLDPVELVSLTLPKIEQNALAKKKHAPARRSTHRR
jgi:murein DD-endopeptidase MepM/ murein hydrolase activator NlpD